MHPRVIDGKAVAAEVRAGVAKDVQALKASHGLTPGLAVVLVYSALFGIGKVVLGETAAGLGLIALAALCFGLVMRNLRR